VTRAAIVLALWLAASSAIAAISFETPHYEAECTACTSVTITNVVVPSVSDGYLLVLGAVDDPTASDRTFSSITCSSHCTLASAAADSNSNAAHAEVWTCASPTATTANCVATPGGTVDGLGATATTFSGVSSTLGNTTTDSTGNSTTWTGALTTSASNSVVYQGLSQGRDTAPSPTSGQTTINSEPVGAESSMYVGYIAVASPGSQSMNMSAASSRWGVCLIELKEATGGSGTLLVNPGMRGGMDRRTTGGMQ